MRANQTNLLVIRCPFKPFLGLDLDASNQDSLSLQAREFTWHLSDESGLIGQSGTGTVESMPYADQVLVLIPTLDVRLIDVKMPLVSDKKLQAILPGLMEEYLLQEVDHVQMQVLAPMPGAPALQRTVVVIDRTWFAWLNKQLVDLLSSRVRLIPDCFLLQSIEPVGAQSNSKLSLADRPSITYEFRGQDLVWTVRTSEQIGASWVERIMDIDLNAEELVTHLPTHLRTEKVSPFNWTCLIKSAHQFIGEVSYVGINLLPSTLRPRSRSGRAASGVDTSEFGNFGAWTDTRVWRSSIRCLGYCFATVVIGISSHLSWLMLSDWRWNQQMQLRGIPFLSPGLASTLVGNHDHQNILSAITKQAIQNKRMHGLVSNADFSQMVSELSRLNAFYEGRLFESLQYDGYALSFELKPEALERNHLSPAGLVTKANSLGLGVIALGGNQFRLLPYAGLGGNL
jgi:hypothetical protein